MERVRRTELSVKLAEIDIEVAENRVAEAKARREAAAAGGAQVDVLTAEIALRDAMLEVRKAKIKFDAERESLRRLQELAEAPARPVLPPPPPGTVALTVPATGGVASVTPAVLPADLRKLREEQLAVAREALAMIDARVQAGAGLPTPDEVITWSKRLCDAQTSLDPGTRAKAAADHLARMRDLEKRVDERVKSGVVSPGAAHAVRYHRLDAEIAVRQAEGGPNTASSGRTPQASRAPYPVPEDGVTIERTPDGRLVAIESFRGTVTGVTSIGGKTFVEFTPGADAGLQKGQMLTVVRTIPGRQESRMIGVVDITQLDPKRGVARYVPDSNQQDNAPRVGDRLRGAVSKELRGAVGK